MDILPGHGTMDLWGSSRPAASTRPATDRADLVTIPALPGRRNPGLRLSYRLTCSDGTQVHVLAVIEHATGRTPGPHPCLEPGLSAGLLSDYETHHNQHRPHRFLRGAAPLKALPEPADLAHYRVRRHARVAGLIHEYRLVPWHGRSFRHAGRARARRRARPPVPRPWRRRPASRTTTEPGSRRPGWPRSAPRSPGRHADPHLAVRTGHLQCGQQGVQP